MAKFQKGHHHSEEMKKKLSESAKKRDPKTRIYVWTEDKIKILKEYYPKLGITGTAKLLGLTPYAVNIKTSKLKIKVEENGIVLCESCHKYVHHLNPLNFQ